MRLWRPAKPNWPEIPGMTAPADCFGEYGKLLDSGHGSGAALRGPAAVIGRDCQQGVKLSRKRRLDDVFESGAWCRY